MAFQLAWRTRIVVLMVPTWPESGFREGVARLRDRGLAWRARARGEAGVGRSRPSRIVVSGIGMKSPRWAD